MGTAGFVIAADPRRAMRALLERDPRDIGQRVLLLLALADLDLQSLLFPGARDAKLYRLAGYHAGDLTVEPVRDRLPIHFKNMVSGFEPRARGIAVGRHCGDFSSPV